MGERGPAQLPAELKKKRGTYRPISRSRNGRDPLGSYRPAKLDPADIAPMFGGTKQTQRPEQPNGE